RIPESLAYVARRRGQWERSESYFNEAERLDPRNVTVLTQHALSYVELRRFPKRCESLIRFSISHRTTWIPWRSRRVSHKPRVVCRVPRRCSLRSTRTPTTPVCWKHKFTRRSWNGTLHQSSLG